MRAGGLAGFTQVSVNWIRQHTGCLWGETFVKDPAV